MSFSTSGVRPRAGFEPRMFIGMWVRIAAKPACISAETARATARASRCRGQRRASGNTSATYSRIAIDSQTTSSPWRSAGTLPPGECRAISATVASWRSGMTNSSNATPAIFIASHGRKDQDE
jgi:hypothetical protein